MKLIDAIKEAKAQGTVMIYRRSKTWHHFGIRTVIDDPEDRKANDWEVVESDRKSL